MVQYFVNKQEAQASQSRCVAVVYETPVLRDYAVHFCERLAQQETSDAVPEINWLPFHVLGHAVTANEAAETAADADIIVFAMNSGGDLPEEVKFWIEKWLTRRGEREGALVGLLACEDGPYDVPGFREIYLRHTARRAGMDYLSHAAPTVSWAIPDSLDSFSRRAGEVTSVLDTILHTHPHTTPPRL